MINVDKTAQKALALAIKAIRFSKDGFDDREKQELVRDLIELAMIILGDIKPK
jgi:hypothetical protein